MCRYLCLSGLGIFIFFVPITLNNKQSIPLDHIVNWIRSGLGEGASWYSLLMIIAGAAYPILTGTWRSSRTDTVFLIGCGSFESTRYILAIQPLFSLLFMEIPVIL